MRTISKEYLQKITDEKMKERFFREENIPILEELIENHWQTLGAITKKEYENNRLLYNGEKVLPHNLEAISLQVYKEVNNFLRIKNKDFPECKFFNISNNLLREDTSSISKKISLLIGGGVSSFIMSHFIFDSVVNILYSPSFPIKDIIYIILFVLSTSIAGKGAKEIFNMAIDTERVSFYHRIYKKIILQTTKKERYLKATVVPTISHEYSHHLQNIFNILNPIEGIFAEGHANSIEKKITLMYTKQTNDPSYLYFLIRTQLLESISGYLQLCKYFQKNPTFSKDLEPIGKRIKKKSSYSPHSIGYPLFALYEKQFGAERFQIMLKEMLHGTFDWDALDRNQNIPKKLLK